MGSGAYDSRRRFLGVFLLNLHTTKTGIFDNEITPMS